MDLPYRKKHITGNNIKPEQLKYNNYRKYTNKVYDKTSSAIPINHIITNNFSIHNNIITHHITYKIVV